MKIFIGWDSREDIAYQVCRASLLKHTSVDLDIVPIKQKHMREKNLYWREHDPLSSTEFTFTRFLVPYLAGYKGWAASWTATLCGGGMCQRCWTTAITAMQ